MGNLQTIQLVGDLTDIVATSSSSGLGMFSAVDRGEQEAVKFFNEHIEEVMRVIPPENLLVFEVKEGWAPLCRFLDLPVPDFPFPNINDTAAIDTRRKSLKRTSYTFIVVLPASICLASWYFNVRDVKKFIGMGVGYVLSLGMMKIVNDGSLMKKGKES
eukprot:TRINITY_DN39275_c0_g1_i1.p1 TRINITY_DN39275_c0_g1~~TRINITY_DN39275_c0_g1_i1.p1  ORF type:complete len:159 (+),score=6.37 TRINITY_DN39275_c0_g1_i1:183-659(+)